MFPNHETRHGARHRERHLSVEEASSYGSPFDCLGGNPE